MALRAFQELNAKKPDSPLAKKALLATARAYQSLAAYENAADAYERYATRFPGEKDAPSALLTAAFFRRGLGQGDRSIEDSEQFIRTWGSRDGFTDRAAGAAFFESQIFEQRQDWERLQRHLQRTSPTGAGAAASTGRSRPTCGWARSPGARPVRRAGAGRLRRDQPAVADRARGPPPAPAAQRRGEPCGVGVTITVHDRNPARAREAQAHFAEALRLWRGGAALSTLSATDEDRASRVADMSSFAAEARMMQGDAEYEALLRMKAPAGLDFTRKNQRAARKFLAWFNARSAQLEKARKSTMT